MGRRGVRPNSERRKCEACNKVCYSSMSDIRNAHRNAGYRVRGYWCSAARAYHAKNAEKA